MTDKPDFAMIGATGLQRQGGYIREEYLTELTGTRWHRVVAEMVNDPTISGILFAIQMLMRQVQWPVQPFGEDEADHESAAFVDACLHDMRESWPTTLSEILSFLPWGYAALEKVYKVRGGTVTRPDGTPDKLRSSKYDDGRVGWATWAIRGQDTLDYWTFDDETDEPIAFVQSPPPSYQPRTVPLGKCLHFRTSSRKANPEGVSMLRGVYRPYYFKRRIENIEGVGIERDLAGLPIAKVPGRFLNASERTAEEAATYTAVKQIVTNIRRDEQEGVVWPNDRDEQGNPYFELELLTTGGTRQFDTGTIVERYDSRIAMAVMADFILLGHQQVGSYSLVSSKTNLFATALGAWLDVICTEINAHIPELLRYNGLDPARAPRLTHGDVEKVELDALGPYLAALVDAFEKGLFNGPGGDRLWRHLLDQAGLPQPTEAEAQSAIEAEQQRQEAERLRQEEEARQRAELLAQQQQAPAAGQSPPPPDAAGGDDEPPDEPAQAAERRVLSDADIDALLDAAFDDARAWAAQAIGA
jgi:hypothetical protein